MGCVLALVACGEPAAPATGVARLALDQDVLPIADQLEVWVRTPEGEEGRQVFVPPWPAEILLPLSPGADRVVELSATVGLLPYALGHSEPVTVEEGATVDVTVVVDPVGTLNVLPQGLALPEVLNVVAEALDPWPGQTINTRLDATGDGFSGVLPEGPYELHFALTDGFLDWIPATSTTIEVAPGVVRTWSEPLIAPDVPIPLPGIAVTLELEVLGGGLVAGLTPLAADLAVRLRDADGRIATGYRGRVSFSSPLLNGLTAALLPEPYAFTEADAGEHTFVGGIQAPISLLNGLLAVLAIDDTGLQARIEIPVSAR